MLTILIKKSILLALISIILSIVLIIIIQFSPLFNISTYIIVAVNLWLLIGIIFDYKNLETRFRRFVRFVPLNARSLYFQFALAHMMVLFFFIGFFIHFENILTIYDIYYQTNVYTYIVNFTSPLGIAIEILWLFPAIMAIIGGILAGSPTKTKYKRIKRKKDVCSKCGAKKTPGYGFCQKCGEKFEI